MYYLNRYGRTHGNLKPENILVDRNQELKLSDIGFSEAIDNLFITNKYTKKISERYISPEIRDGELPSSTSDIWSLGVILLELAYGREEFKNSVIMSMNSERSRKEFEIRGGYSHEMKEITGRCFELDPSKRETIEEFLNENWLKSIADVRQPSIR